MTTTESTLDPMRRSRKTRLAVAGLTPVLAFAALLSGTGEMAQAAPCNNSCNPGPGSGGGGGTQPAGHADYYLAFNQSVAVPTYLFGRTEIDVRSVSGGNAAFSGTSLTTVVPGSVNAGATNTQTLYRSWVGAYVRVRNLTSGTVIEVTEPHGP